MIICPYCDGENISGADICDRCGQTLSDLNLPVPATHVERCLLRDRLGVLPPIAPVATVSPDTTVGEVLRMLSQRSIGCVLVTRHNRLVGIFSERDALLKLNTRAAELAEHPVAEFMTSDPQSLDLDAKVAFALHRMSVGHYRHVPVIDAEGRPSAIISVRDVLRYLTEKMVESEA